MSEKSPASEKAAPDWALIELDYRAGIKTLRQIGEENGISHPAITKRAKKLGWTRDLSAKIQERAEQLVTNDAVTKAVTKEALVTEKRVVEVNAQAVADIRLAHRRDIQRSRSIVMRLLDELELQTGPEAVALLEQLGELMFEPDDKGIDKLNELYHKIISLPGRAKTMKDLGETLRVLVGLERQAFGMIDKGEDPDGKGGSAAVLKQMTDTERAVRLSRLFNQNPEALTALLPGVSQ